MIKLTIGVVLTGMLAVTGCGAKSGASGDDTPEIDAGPGEACATAADCPTEFPICSANGSCVGCETSADCSDPTPICTNGSCAAACAGSEVNADFVAVPSDIIFVVDQSGSMNQETVYVQQQINNFATQISASAIDYRVVMIARTTPTNAICVPPPLGGPACGNNTRFRLVNQYIDSNDGPAKMIQRYGMYSDFLRPEAKKHIVFVTDDESRPMTAAQFTSGLAALLPAGMFTGFKVHGIYAYGSGTNGCTGMFGSGAADGTVYTTLVAQTMGARGVICTGDWTQVLADIQTAVVSGSQVSCNLTIPAAPMGQTIDPSTIAVNYQLGGVAPGTTLPHVMTVGDCTGTGGWYFDNNAMPTMITLCPATCTSVQSDPDANVKLELGCSTQIF